MQTTETELEKPEEQEVPEGTYFSLDRKNSNGHSFIYYGQTVLGKSQSVLEQLKRTRACAIYP